MVGRFPVAIVEDRYGGVYSGGKWLAASNADTPCNEDGETRAQMMISPYTAEGPYGGDAEAMKFWADPPDWISVGGTPDEAVAALKKE